jgi:hypothetical protein
MKKKQPRGKPFEKGDARIATTSAGREKAGDA